MSKSIRRDFAPAAVRNEMGDQMWRHDIVRAVTKKLYNVEIARPGKTAFEKQKLSKKIQGA